MADKTGYIGRNPSDSSVTIARQSFLPTGVQTNFTFNSGYTPGFVDVYVNGVKLVNALDFTAVSGGLIKLSKAAVSGDVVEVVAYKAFSVGDPISSVAGNLSVGGNLTATNGTFTGTVSAGVGSFVTQSFTNLSVTGVATFSSNVNIAGTLTYDDVVNIDSLGIVTARKGVRINDGGIVISGVSTADNVVEVRSDDGTPGRVDLYCEVSNAHYARIQAPPHSDFAGNITLTLPSSTGTLLSNNSATVATDLSIADKIVHTGDTNTAIRFPAADTITAETGGTERLRIKSDGFVGIGTNNPGQKLVISNDGNQGLEFNVTGTDNTIIAAYDRSSSQYVDIGYQSNDHIFFGDTTERLRIKNDGKVGIGTTIPTAEVEVQGRTLLHNRDSAYAGTIQTRADVLTLYHEPAPVFPISGDPQDQNRQLSIIGGISTNYACASLRTLGSNAFWDFVADGNTNSFYVQRQNSYPTITWDTNENIGFGTVIMGSTQKVTIGSRVAFMNRSGLAVYNPHSLGLKNGIFVRTTGSYNSGASYRVSAFKTSVPASNGAARAFVAAYDALTGGTGGQVNYCVTHSGFVGVGTDAPESALHVQPISLNPTAPTKPGVHIGEAGTNDYHIHFATKTASGNNAYLDFSVPGVDYRARIIKNMGGAFTINQAENQNMVFQTNGATRMTIAGGGAVNVVGSLSKGSGSFKIDHPLVGMSTTHNLVHSFIEGPQADLIYRGKVDLVDGSATVNIDTAGRMTEGTFDALCTNVQCFTSNETDWTAVKGSMSGNVLTITAQDNTSTATVSWMVIGERKDQHMIDTEWTDDNGRVITEPLKEPIEGE